MIDLHIHTTKSDGLKTPHQILEESQKIGLNTISITDHNTVQAYKEIENDDVYKGFIIQGCELTCMFEDICMELLAYGYDLNTLEKYIKENYLPFSKMNVLETNLVIEKLLKTPLIINRANIKYDIENEYGNRGVHREIIRHPENKQYIDDLAWEDAHEFSLRYLSNKSSMFYVDYSSLLPDYMDVIKAIRNAGGLVFMPHIYKYREYLEKIKEKIIYTGILDGIECYHSSFSQDEISSVIEMATNNGLYMSGGTDTHGYEGKDEVYLAFGYGNMNIPDDIIKPWSKKLIRK